MISSLELARRCGVSQGTVDRALHNRPGVSPATRERILREAQAHGYLPHPAAREILSGESRLLGALVPAVNSLFFMDLMQAVKNACADAGLRLWLMPVTHREEFLEVLADCAARRFAGVLAVPPEEGIVLPPAITGTLPVATLLSPCLGERTQLFAPDEVATGARAVDYLAECGHRAIIHVSYARHAHAVLARARGYETAMRARGLTPVVCRADSAATLRAVIDAHHPTAFFCHNDWIALAVIRHLASAGIRVPEEMAVLGVDDSPTFTHLYPGITTLRYPGEEVARQAIAWIHRGVAPATIPTPTVVVRTTA